MELATDMKLIDEHTLELQVPRRRNIPSDGKPFARLKTVKATFEYAEPAPTARPRGIPARAQVAIVSDHVRARTDKAGLSCASLVPRSSRHSCRLCRQRMLPIRRRFPRGRMELCSLQVRSPGRQHDGSASVRCLLHLASRKSPASISASLRAMRRRGPSRS